ncbi:MAG: hypothetical protein KatS3mg027_1254 [Bacteroidia bacterium]|nr:MAG: hypothetical protein KatS3mg027_1254 [Bacteroidia bacterium]
MKIYFKNNKFIFGALVIMLYSCNNRDYSDETKVIKQDNIDTLKQNQNIPKNRFIKSCVKIQYNSNNEWNNTISLLTGDKNTFRYKALYDSSYWEMYHEFIDISWGKLERQRLSKIKKWREQELAFADTLTHTIFYPFSGPDFLTVSVLFPKADTFIMLGLEPVGALPDFSRMTAEQQQSYLSNFSNALGDIFDKSYFITRKMLHDFQSQKVNGLLPVLGFFVKNLNYDIADIKYFYKDSANQIKEMDYYTKEKIKPMGVKLTAVKDSCAKTIYYFRYNVMDKYFNDSSSFYKFLDSFKNYVTYIKSASYLLHNPFMSNMRKMILEHSVAILQDDTGVPYRFLSDSTKWQLRLYGEYDKPVKDFGKMGYQPDLARRMKEDSIHIPKLPFHLGYHWGSKKDVLILAIKK